MARLRTALACIPVVLVLLAMLALYLYGLADFLLYGLNGNGVL